MALMIPNRVTAATGNAGGRLFVSILVISTKCTRFRCAAVLPKVLVAGYTRPPEILG